MNNNNNNSMLVGDEGEDSAAICRERRRRRMAMRRIAARGGSQKTIDNPLSSTTETMNLISSMETMSSTPVYGKASVIGRQRQMVDEVSVQTDLCWPEINGFQPVHFFGVFDGHVSTLCKEHMHVIVKEELMRVKVVGDESNDGDNGGKQWKLAVNRSFQRMNKLALKLCRCRGVINSSSSICRCNPQLSIMGSQAVVAILTKECLVVANCGDSGAVICTRDGWPISLSVEFTGDKGCGGGGVVSRPIDGISFWGTSEPKISITKREARDEFLILGSNGLWDVVSSESACKTVHECVRSSSVEPRYIEGSELAAAILVRLALGRRSADNISVIVIDLKE